MTGSELLGRVEVAAGAASACRPWTKADTHGTSNRAVLHNSNLNIFKNNWLPLCKKVYKVPGFFNVLSTVILGLQAWSTRSITHR